MSARTDGPTKVDSERMRKLCIHKLNLISISEQQRDQISVDVINNLITD